MSKVRVAAFSVSIDGFGAGPRQDLQNPLGVRGTELHSWFFQTEIFKKMHGQSGGVTGIDNDIGGRSFENVGAWILGRNMFGPVRGPWKDDSWKGWWGENPPYHCPVFVLTHHARSPLAMEGGTTFYFVTDGLESALEACARGGRRQGRANWRRSLRDPAIPERGKDRRNASRCLAGAAGRRRAFIFRNQSGATWIRAVPDHRGRECDSRFYKEKIATLPAEERLWETTCESWERVR